MKVNMGYIMYVIRAYDPYHQHLLFPLGMGNLSYCLHR